MQVKFRRAKVIIFLLSLLKVEILFTRINNYFILLFIRPMTVPLICIQESTVNLIAKHIILFFLILYPAMLFSQNYSLTRYRVIDVADDTIQFDTLSVQANSFYLTDSTGKIISPDEYDMLFAGARLVLSDRLTDYFSELYAYYRVYPYDFSETISHKDMDRLEPDDKGIYNPFMYQAGSEKEDYFSFGGLQKSGSISRGVSFGNKQDVVVNSNLDLQLSGDLGKDVKILAAVTDNNIPIQPEGNTQQIQDFDKVYIKLAYKDFDILAGDFELQSPDGHFMKFYKKAQGGEVKGVFVTPDEKKIRYSSHAAAAVSKGKFSRNQIQGIEGNQGPYRLRGNENETFIIVLAGSEKVYLDGQLLIRGQDQDYTINYNTAEITFMPAVMITKDKRIIVEFEYSDKRYARSIFFASQQMQTGKLNIRFNAYSEQDIKSQSIQPELNDEQKLLLSQIGDSLKNAVSYNIDSIGFSSDEVLYKMIDTSVNAVFYDTVFVYSTNEDSAYYRLGFSNVGDGNGHYIQLQSAANGRVFQWIAPDENGQLQGSFEPLMLLITPKQKQMLSMISSIAFNPYHEISLELAYSNYDENLFSDKDKKDDQGTAFHLNYKNKIFLSDSMKNRTLGVQLDYEYLSRNFNAIEPFREVEFNRDWNLSDTDASSLQHQGRMNVMYASSDITNFSYGFDFLNRGEKYNAYRNRLNFQININSFLFSFEGSLMNSNDYVSSASFLKHTFHIRKNIKSFLLGIKEYGELNLQKLKESDSLLFGSFSSQEYTAYVKIKSEGPFAMQLSYRKRFDALPGTNELSSANEADLMSLDFSYKPNLNNKLKIQATYRNLYIKDEQ